MDDYNRGMINATAKTTEANQSSSNKPIQSCPGGKSDLFQILPAHKQLVEEWQQTHFQQKIAPCTPSKLMRCIKCRKLYSPSQCRSHKYFHKQSTKGKWVKLAQAKSKYICRILACEFYAVKSRRALLSHLKQYSGAELATIGLRFKDLGAGMGKIEGISHAANPLDEFRLPHKVAMLTTTEHTLSKPQGICMAAELEIPAIQSSSHYLSWLHDVALDQCGLWTFQDSLFFEVTNIVSDAQQLGILIIDDSSIFCALGKDGQSFIEYPMKELLSSKRKLSQLFQSYKVLRMSRINNLPLVDKLGCVALYSNSVYLSTSKSEISLGKLLSMGGNLTETQEAVQALIDAVQQIHSTGIVHRNITPSCLAITDVEGGQASLKNFEWSTNILDEDKLYTLPPNIYCPRRRGWQAGSIKHDAWALGAIVVQAVTHQAI